MCSCRPGPGSPARGCKATPKTGLKGAHYSVRLHLFHTFFGAPSACPLSLLTPGRPCALPPHPHPHPTRPPCRYMGTIHGLLQGALGSESMDVQLAAMKATCNFIQVGGCT